MLTDAPPRKALTEFPESDRIKSLDLPPNAHLRESAERLEVVMRTGATVEVRNACAEFLTTASDFYGVPTCGIRVLAARPLRVRESWATELFGDYNPENHADSRMDADSDAEGDHILGHS